MCLLSVYQICFFWKLTILSTADLKGCPDINSVKISGGVFIADFKIQKVRILEFDLYFEVNYLFFDD